MRQTDAGFQPASDHQPPTRACIKTTVLSAHQRFRTDGHGDIEGAANFQSVETWRRDADDFNRVIGDGEFAADDVRGTAKFALPETMTNDGARRTASAYIIARGHEPAPLRLNAKHIEEVAADP